jgi:hypothetical protein
MLAGLIWVLLSIMLFTRHQKAGGMGLGESKLPESQAKGQGQCTAARGQEWCDPASTVHGCVSCGPCHVIFILFSSTLLVLPKHLFCFAPLDLSELRSSTALVASSPLGLVLCLVISQCSAWKQAAILLAWCTVCWYVTCPWPVLGFPAIAVLRIFHSEAHTMSCPSW